MNVAISLRYFAACCCCGIALELPAGERILANFTVAEPRPALQTNQALVTFGSTGLRMVTPASDTWPGITLTAPGPGWDLSPYANVTVTVRNAGTNSAGFFCRVDNPGADGTRNCLTGSKTIEAGQTAVLQVPLTRSSPGKLNGKLFGMRGYPVQPGGERTINPSNVTAVLLFVGKPRAGHTLEITRVVAEGTYTPPTAWVTDADPFFPFIDTFGQYRHKTWPGKVVSEADLQQGRRAERAELAAATPRADWTQYGGWATGPERKATGWFRTEKFQGKWWLVDPEGKLFWSHGIDCVRMMDQTPIEERDTWFENPPWEMPEYANILSKGFALKGHYAGQSPKCFSFASANLRRKYGAEWRTAVPEIIHQRLRAWGVNTIGNWSDESTRLMRRTPYVDTFGTRTVKTIEGSEGYWAKFPDVFDAGFAPLVRQAMASRAGKAAGDPWCIGFFSDNEMSWGDELSLGLATLKSPASQAAKKVFTADLKAKYATIEELNDAWGTRHADWDALINTREAPDAKRARPDLEAFYTKTAETYFREARDAVRSAAPNQLYLGCRFAWVNSLAAAAAAKYCDVVSYNIYDRDVRDFQFNGGADVPLIIGEFHFGALDRGMFHTGLVSVSNQQERAYTYRAYVEGALEHPQFVGTHWFQYQDEPTTGRVYDEENYQIGFVDIADTPYPEITTAAKQVAEKMYKLRIGALRR